MAEGVTTPYSTVAPMFGAVPGWIPALEAERIQSYGVYEDIYWNNPDTFKITARGSEDSPIYVPTGRTIIDTTNRYVGVGWDFLVDPTVGTPEVQALATRAFMALFRREKMKSKYAMNKRFGLIRGDWLWHIIADPTKPAGRRISIRAAHPSAWFPVYDDNDLDRILKHHFAEAFTTADGKDRVKRLTYERLDTGAIQVSEGIFELKDWSWDFQGKGRPTSPPAPETVLIAPMTLPPQITAFPVYHIKNFEEPGNPYGSSELRGLERIMAGVNQAISDEDVALALQGLGLYATDSGGPIDPDTGEDMPWELGPGRVVENVTNFRRVEGVSSVTPSQDHINMLVNFMKEASGTPDAAIGKVDVAVAESGISLMLQLGPMLSKAGEKDQEIVDVHTQMFYDLKFWFQAYEALQFTDADIIPVLGDKLPHNVAGEIDNIMKMMSTVPPLMSAETGRKRLAELGVRFADNESDLVAGQQTEAVPGLAERVAAELATLGGVEGSDTPSAEVSA